MGLRSVLVYHTKSVNGIKMHFVEAGGRASSISPPWLPGDMVRVAASDSGTGAQLPVIAPDLRGYGETEKPASGYDKHTMARDIYELMRELGYRRAPLVGHDCGARAATRFAKDYPEATERLVVMDNIPTRVIFERMNAEVARGHWFFIFNNVPDLPEALITGREEIWLRFVFSSWTYNPELFSREEIAEYVRAYSKPGALRGAFSDYRAGREDVRQDEEDKEKLISCPTLVLWGEHFAIGGKMWDFREIWREMAQNPQYVSIPQCGHLPHEEKPERVNAELLRFLTAQV